MAATLHSLRRFDGVAALLFLVALGTPGPAGSLNEAPGPSFLSCPLERIGTQLVRCDNLTGAGVEAPFWIPEQQ
ncbi:hypothetical protein [Arthrobacter sp. SLBN-122]|uniref:hypothetical protein n=1 Tax=Arthrobacter sp. SLBN-122 TaxID=2768455 RepID=UPI001152BC37|nr:hypothetical protein [Arthrobacter sp. SLBN-122]TQJ36361.1 hypothetical protein FBY36_3661 [Arthrobacter sp. SLBN-122]